MRIVNIELAEPGMVLARDIYDEHGRTLIGRGCILTEEYIEGLENRGIFGVYIDDEISRDIDIKEAIPEAMRQEGIRYLVDGNIDGCLEVAKKIVDELLESSEISFDIRDIRAYDNYTYAHSVNVAVLCGAIGIGMQLEAEQQYQLVLAALLHDLGKMMIPTEILNKPDRLTKEEYETIKTHAELSHKILAERWDISSNVKNAVLFHHENYDGTGYPRGLMYDDIPLFASIIHVADVYDALISKRPYKNPYSPGEAAEYLMGASGVLFQPEIVNVLLKYVPIYQKGQMVTLSNGEKAIVYENRGGHVLRPVVKLENGALLDLSDDKNLTITITGGDTDSPDLEGEKIRSRTIEQARKKKIMVVDDMKTNLAMLRAMLKNEYELNLLRSGEQAIGCILKKEYPDLILMDIDMPDMDGIEAATRIQNMTKNKVPIIFVTVLADRETVLKCKALNPAGYVLRPYNEVFLKSEIERIVDGVIG